MTTLNPIDRAKEFMTNWFYHEVLPWLLVLLAVATLIFSPMRAVWRLLFAVIFVGIAIYLWGGIPGVT